MRSIHDYGDCDVFKPGERWRSPRGTCYYVHGVQVGSNATLRTLGGPWAQPIPGGYSSPGRIRRVPWDGVKNWVRYAASDAGEVQP